MTCFFCKGSMENNVTTHFSDLGTCVIVVKNVPCHTCVQCGEVAYSLNVGERIEQIIAALKNSMAEVAIVQYSEAA